MRQPDTYVHLTARSVEHAIREIHHAPGQRPAPAPSPQLLLATLQHVARQPQPDATPRQTGDEEAGLWNAITRNPRLRAALLQELAAR